MISVVVFFVNAVGFAVNVVLFLKYFKEFANLFLFPLVPHDFREELPSFLYDIQKRVSISLQTIYKV